MPDEVVDNGEVALRLLDELVHEMTRQTILSAHDIQQVIAHFTAEAELLGSSPPGEIAKRAAERVLGWLPSSVFARN